MDSDSDATQEDSGLTVRKLSRWDYVEMLSGPFIVMLLIGIFAWV
jgi:hypothetical protein